MLGALVGLLAGPPTNVSEDILVKEVLHGFYS